MNWVEFRAMLNRAAAFSIDKKKLLFTACALFCCGLVMIFGMSLAISFGPWVAESLYVIPFFVTIGLLLSLGVILIRSYHDEVKEKEVKPLEILTRSIPTLLNALSLFVPLVLGYLSLWFANGLYLLMSDIPFIGQPLATLFIFIPFLLHVATITLLLATIYLAFALSPTFALSTLWQEGKFKEIVKEAFQSPLERLGIFCIAIVPLFLTLAIGLFASYLSVELLLGTKGTLDLVMKWFFMMLPFSLLLSPSVIFLFNMATEAHILIYKQKS